MELVGGVILVEGLVAGSWWHRFKEISLPLHTPYVSWLYLATSRALKP